MSGFQVVLLRAGDVIFRENDYGDCAYMIDVGSVEISVERDGEKVVVAHVGPGEFVGEMAILTDAPRTATAIVAEDAMLRKISAEQFTQRVSEMEPVMQMAIETALHRLSTTLTLLKSDGSHDAIEHRRQGNSAALATLQLEAEIAAGVRRDEFRLYYQPIIELASGKLHGFEGLIRWQHPERGFLAPDHFIPTASKSDLIQLITSFCLAQACKDLPLMRAACLANLENVLPPTVSINITGRDLENDDIVQRFDQAVTENQLTHDALTFEVTETSLMHDKAQAADVLSKIRALGADVAIDDFGTGYSSMAHLSRLPSTILKIDRSFVSAMNESEQDRKIVTIILSLARELNMSVVAEGIETRDDHDFLKAHGSDYGQGYLFAKPMPLNQAVTMIKGWDAVSLTADSEIERRIA